ncbi:hypothetical protein GJ688_00465 [Heliobacillus mobilis]|uniref:Anti-sigma-W factor RsiW n=1 Tax=Heliobacterium mobile TaxID=28064 RepID=A0A6I3SBZ6_HELMO|nr:zf-HC2 domain-containing protein [Heliobacterium mobile]MTV47449.1 hypothetical protein [Heliobacterium mobile]
MSRCEKIRWMLSAYADGQLSCPDRDFVQSHLQDCPECEKVLAELTEFDLFLQEAMVLEEPPEGLFDSIWTSLESESIFSGTEQLVQQVLAVKEEPDLSWIDLLQRQGVIAAGWAGLVVIAAFLIGFFWPQIALNWLEHHPAINHFVQNPGGFVVTYFVESKLRLTEAIVRHGSNVRNIVQHLSDFYLFTIPKQTWLWTGMAAWSIIAAWLWRRQITD